jgi:hypothetical protein
VLLLIFKLPGVLFLPDVSCPTNYEYNNAPQSYAAIGENAISFYKPVLISCLNDDCGKNK